MLALPSSRLRHALAIAAVIGVALLVGLVGRSRSTLAASTGVPYRPCPEQAGPCRVLPLGDSITWGIGYDGGYRVGLFERALGEHKQLTFTGSLKNGPESVNGTAFPRQHEGRSGWTIEQVLNTVPYPAFETTPHIVLLHVGTNDVYAHHDPEAIADRLDALLDCIEHVAPRALIVVAEIIPLTDPALRDTAARYNAELRRRVAVRRARGEHVLSVDQFRDFSTSLLSDGVHPTRAGYEQMAATWYAAIAPYLPEKN